jgi:hypothetical protein
MADSLDVHEPPGGKNQGKEFQGMVASITAVFPRRFSDALIHGLDMAPVTELACLSLLPPGQMLRANHNPIPLNQCLIELSAYDMEKKCFLLKGEPGIGRHVLKNPPIIIGDTYPYSRKAPYQFIKPC